MDKYYIIRGDRSGVFLETLKKEIIKRLQLLIVGEFGIGMAQHLFLNLL